MRRKMGKKVSVLSGLLMLALIVSLCTAPVSAAVSTGSGLTKGTAIGDTGYSVTSIKSYGVAPGVKEYTYNTNNSELTSQTVCNVMEIDPTNGARPVVAYGNLEDPTDWCRMTTSDMCKLWEDTTGENVVGAINGGWWNMTTGEPTGTTVIRGTTVKTDSSYPYIATYSDGSYTIEEAGVSLETAAKNQTAAQGKEVSVEGALAGRALLVKNGKVDTTTKGNQGNYTRTAIGIKEDGTLIIFQADGAQAPRSVGLTQEDEAKMMIELGCVTAMQLDEGGSSTFITQREGEDDLVMRNTPTDGVERKIACSILVVSDVAATGTFDHANISPDDEYYTPDSEVELTATAVDYSGTAVDSMPSGTSWELEDTDMGTLTEGSVKGNTSQATFISNGKTGDAAFNLMYEGKAVGSTTVHIQNPDTIAFTNEEVSVNYGEDSDLGLTASYDNEVVHLKDGDIQWTITYIVEEGQEEYDSENYPIGYFIDDGLIFHATDDVTVSCTVQVTASYGSLSAVTTVELGKEPLIIADGGDYDGREYILGKANACVRVDHEVEDTAFLGDSFGLFSYLNSDGKSTRGGESSLSLVSANDEEYADIVRFGENAIRIDYDWTNINGIDGACFGPGESIEVTGSPTALGVWIYIPDENTPLPWCRLQIATSVDGGDTWVNAYVNFLDWFTDEDTGKSMMKTVNGDLLQVGWNYIEADLTPYVQAGTMVRINAGMLFRAMVKTDVGDPGWTTIDGTVLNKADLTGWILFDELCFVYGVNNQDTTNPQVTSLGLMDEEGTCTEMENGMTVSQNTLSFYADYDDHEDSDPFAMGVDVANFYIDGNVMEGEERINNHSTLMNVTLANGEHTFTFYVKDGYGNVTRESRTFYVEGDDVYPSLSLTAEEEPYVNQDWTLTLSATHPEDIVNASVTMVINNRYPVTDVEFTDGVDGTWAYVKSSGTLTIEISEVKVKELKVYSESATKLADIIVSIPQDIEQGSSITVQVTKGSYDTTVENMTGSFSTASRANVLEAAYIVTTDTLIVGKDGTIYVQTEDGSPAADVTVYMEEVPDEESSESDNDSTVLTDIGQTNEDGTLITDKLTKEQSDYVLYAADEDEHYWSYKTPVTAYAPAKTDGNKPYNISMNISADETTQQNISWMSGVDAEPAAYIRYSTTEDLSDAKTVEGTDTLLTYSIDGLVNRANNVQLSDLEADTTYYYMVGDGETWSDVDTFSTLEQDPDDVSFVVMADVQEEDALTGFSNIAAAIAAAGRHYDFGVQTGDAVDESGSYAEWMDAMELFTLPEWGDMDWLHVLGNHDILDITNNDKAAKPIFGVNEDYYSLEYGDVYIAVMNYTTDRQTVKEFGEWLVEDAAKSSCTWKFVFSHSSVYYTNPTYEAQMYQEVLPSYMQEAGIDFYMSGHDHSYSRTYPMFDGEVGEDGIYYTICGTTGGKSYPLNPDPAGHFEIATLDFESVYLDVSTQRDVDGNSITVTAYDVEKDGTVNVLDTFGKEIEYCANGDHSYVWDRETDKVTCSECPFTSTMKKEIISGLVRDAETGRLMYLIAGQPQTGYVTEGTNVYYFDENGLAYKDGTYTFCGETCTMKDGQVVSWENEKVIDIGMAGFNIGFVVYDDYSMYLEGEGDMWDFTRGTAPWAGNRGTLKSVTISNGITSIGNSAFQFYHSLTKIIFEEGSSVKTIGTDAFREIYSVNEVILPDSVTTISSHAFADSLYVSENKTSFLKSVYIPDGITYIADDAFSGNSENFVLNVGYQCAYAIQYAEDNGLNYVEHLTSCTMQLSDYSYDYDGSAKEPEVTLLYKSKPQDLVLGTDYTVKYSNNIHVGTATVTVTGINHYTGTLTEQFTIMGTATTTTKLLKLKAIGKDKKVTLKWNKVENADGYLIYGGRNSKNYKLIKTIKNGSKQKYTVKNLKKGKAYKYGIKAYKLVDGEKMILKTSNSVHVFTNGNKNHTNAKKVEVKKSTVTLSVGKTSKISAKVKKVESGKKLSKRVSKIRYRSSNKKVATVNAKGKIKAVKSGKCTILAYAANGKLAKVKVTVK